jgi:uncharacterized protein (TIGR04222 family)
VWEPYLLVVVFLPAWAVLMALPVSGRSTPLSIAEVGFLRQGKRGAVGTVVTGLYVDRLIEVQGRAFVRGGGPSHTAHGPLGQAVFETLAAPATLFFLSRRSEVGRQLAGMRDRLATEGLTPGRERWLAARAILVVVNLAALVQVSRTTSLGAWLLWVMVLLATVALWFVPRRTVAGHLRLAALRRGEGEVVTFSQQRVATNSVRKESALAFALGTATPPNLVSALARLPRRRIGPAENDWKKYLRPENHPFG